MFQSTSSVIAALEHVTAASHEQMFSVGRAKSSLLCDRVGPQPDITTLGRVRMQLCRWRGSSRGNGIVRAQADHAQVTLRFASCAGAAALLMPHQAGYGGGSHNGQMPRGNLT